MMMGQNDILEQFGQMLDDFPKFIILVGMKGSGKKTLAHEVYKMLANHDTADEYMLEDTKVDTIRSMISDAKKVIKPTLYIIPDADKMSNAAKNSMLKITEEPPRNAYFILTLENESNALETIKSRGQIYKMKPYSPETIHEYAKTQGIKSLEETEIVLDICETPGEVDVLKKTGIIALYDYVAKVIDNIAMVSGSNAFKIADKIALKDEQDKYDLRLFWKAFMKVCSDRIRTEKDVKYAHAIKITSHYMQQLNITGINKSSTFDLWILDIREAWL